MRIHPLAQCLESNAVICDVWPDRRKMMSGGNTKSHLDRPIVPYNDVSRVYSTGVQILCVVCKQASHLWDSLRRNLHEHRSRNRLNRLSACAPKKRSKNNYGEDL